MADVKINIEVRKTPVRPTGYAGVFLLFLKGAIILKKNEYSEKVLGRLRTLLCLLFLGAICLIAAGLWLWSRIASILFLGITLLYLSYCLSKVINSARKE